MNCWFSVKNRARNSSARLPTTVMTMEAPMRMISTSAYKKFRTVSSRMFSGAALPKALRMECSTHPVARMGNHTEKIKLNHSSCGLWFSVTYTR